MRPGVLLVLAKFDWRVNVLIALDFPAFERPAKAISKPSSGGVDFKSGELLINLA